MKNQICCKKCNCNIFIVKSMSKKSNKDNDFTCFLYCSKCDKKLILKKGTKINLIRYKK